MWGRTEKQTFRTRKREKAQYRRRAIVSGISTLCLGLALFGVWYGARLPMVTISDVAVDGGSTVSHDEIRDQVEAQLAGTYALLIPHRFSYLFPRQKIEAAVNAVPRVHNAAVVLGSRNELDVSFDEYVPYALWCDLAAASSTDASSTEAFAADPDNCIFVDDKGYAFAPAPPLMGETLVRFMVEGRKPSVGEHVYDPDTLAQYRALIAGISDANQHRLRAMTETRDGDLVLHLSQGTDLLITKNSDIHVIFETLESILSSETYKDVPFDEFQYIDLRFGNKVYVKRRGIEPDQPVTPEPVPPKVGGTDTIATTTSDHH